MKKVIGCKPVGSQILVEHLTAQEAYGTKLHLAGDTKLDIPQAIILAIGPNVEVERYGFQVGSRVILQGQFVPVPSYGTDDPDTEHKRGLVEPHTIKAVLIEENIL